MAILNIVTLFNPMRIFLPLALACVSVVFVWGRACSSPVATA